MSDDTTTRLSDLDFETLADLMGLAELSMKTAEISEEIRTYRAIYTGILLVMMRSDRYLDAKRHVADSLAKLMEDEE